MRTYFLLCFLTIGLLCGAGCASGNGDDDPCLANPQPGCPNYVDPDPTLANTITLGSVAYTVDSTYMEKLEDGFWYLYAQLKNASKPLVIHAVRFRCNTPGYTIEAWSGKDSINGKETPSAMVSRYAAAGRQVKVAINGGFYGMGADGVPTGVEVVKGMMVCLGDVNQPSIGFDGNNKPYIDNLRFDAKVKSATGVERPITTINTTRWENLLVLFNSAKGKRTGANQYGCEALCAPKTGQWETLDNHINVACRVEQIESHAGNMAIPKGKFVLSGHGTSDTYLSSNLRAGDDITVTVDYTFPRSPGHNSADVRNIVSGYNIVLKNNAVVTPDPTQYTSDEYAILVNNNPRTSAGYSDDKKYVYFAVVEGRRTGVSVGVSTAQLGQIMQYLGATDALNLDGGGSSCLTIGSTAKNYLSDGSQRAVCNGLAIIKK